MQIYRINYEGPGVTIIDNVTKMQLQQMLMEEYQKEDEMCKWGHL